MKKLFFVLAGSVTMFVLSSFILNLPDGPQDQPVKINSIPGEVTKVIEQKCFGCHNSESRNEDAKKELSFDKWDELNILQKLAKTKELHKTVTEAEMPPKKFLERFPDKKLSDDEVKILTDWAKNELEK